MSRHGDDRYITDHGEYDQVRWWEPGPVGPPWLARWLAAPDKGPSAASFNSSRPGSKPTGQRVLSPATVWWNMLREGRPAAERLAFLKDAYPKPKPARRSPPIRPNVKLEAR